MRLPEMDGAHMSCALCAISILLYGPLWRQAMMCRDIGEQFANDPSVHILQKPFDMEAVFTGS
jgi:hypothetical protein